MAELGVAAERIYLAKERGFQGIGGGGTGGGEGRES
jgi:hypothetical protein